MSFKPLLLIALVAGCTLGAQTQDDLNRRLTSLHTRVYSLENILLKPFETTPADDVKDWRKLMADITRFATDNGNPSYAARMMRTLNEASEKLISERTRTWDVSIKGSIVQKEPKTGLSKIDKEKIDFTKMKLEDVIQGNSELQFKNRGVIAIQGEITDLNKSRSLSEKNKAALDVMNRLALTLQLTIEKYQRDLTNLKNAKGK